jgi:hypothetical protein
MLNTGLPVKLLIINETIGYAGRYFPVFMGRGALKQVYIH